MADRIKLKHRYLASRVRQSRLSQNHWALRLGLDRGHFSQLARGKRPYPSSSTRRKLLEGLEADWHDLFEVEEYPPLKAPASRRGSSLFRDPSVRRPWIETRENAMETLVKDLRYAIRRLLRSPAFTILAVLPLAVGIGANSTIFSFVNVALLRPLPAESPEQLRRIATISTDGASTARMSYADYEEYRDRAEVFADLVAISLVPVTLTVGEQTDQVLAEVVSGNFFPALGIRAALGRMLESTDDGHGGEQAAVVSHAFWQRRLGSDPEVLGRKVILSGEPFTVVGVVSPSFTGTFAGAGIDVWTPIEPSARWFGGEWRSDRADARFQLMGRLRPGMDDDRALAALNLLATNLGEEYPDTHRGRRIEMMPASLLAGGLRRAVATFLAVVTLMVGLVLLLACANIGHLFLARALDRRREMAIRLAMGAGRLRLGRQLLTESVVVAGLGGVGGFLVALWSARLLSTWNPVSFIPLRLDLAPDARVLLFTVLISLLTGVLLGLVPVLQAGRRDLVSALKGEASLPLGGARKVRLRSVFLMTQIALSLVLLISAALFLRSLTRVRTADPGFDPEGALAMDLDLEVAGFSEDEGRRFFQRLLPHLESRPDIESASLANLAPLDLATPRRAVTIAGHEPAPESPGLRLSMNRIAPGYFRTLGIPLLAGRDFTEQDRDAGMGEKAGARTASWGAAIVNETLAERFWPGKDPVGQSFRVEGGERARPVQVVGLARDVKYRTFGEEPTSHFYLPLEQDFQLSMTLLVRTRSKPRPMIADVQRELEGLHGNVRGFFSRTLVDHMAFATLPARVAAVLFSLFGGVALLLAMVGIYGAVTYSVVGRTREFGIRVALGAKGRDVVRLVLRESLTVAGWGVALGLILSLALGRLLSSLLFGVSASDPLILSAVCGLVLAVVALASYVPARRATRIDPLLVLRQE